MSCPFGESFTQKDSSFFDPFSCQEYMPVAGEIIEVNDGLNDSPETVNSDPYGEGWMIKVRPDQPDSISNLLDAESYGNEIGG